jgi:anti-sigma regulatory factor (Ser/Thr protein kinase)
MTSTSRRFPATSESVPQAREFVAAELRDLPSDVLNRALLMVSELSTNALIHAGTSFEVEIEHDERELTITVRDTGPGVPTLRNPLPREAHGRGLKIVTALSNKWDVVDLGDHGKAVWFSVVVEPLPSALSLGA